MTFGKKVNVYTHKCSYLGSFSFFFDACVYSSIMLKQTFSVAVAVVVASANVSL